MKCIVLSEPISQWLDDGDVLETIRNVDGTVVRSKEGRTTRRVEISGKGYYVKLHEGIGWREVVKNLLQFKLPVVGASNEWLAIRRLHELGIPTLNAVAYGSRGFNPARQQSFLITEELTDTFSLARLAEDWLEKPPPFTLKYALLEAVACTARIIHGAGINHRDLYICHFLVDISMGLDRLDSKNVKLFLVDLHRAQMRNSVPRRWLVKDLASIYFSSLDVGLTKKDVFRFLKLYFQLPLRQILTEKKTLLVDISRRATSLYLRDFKRKPVLPVKP